MVEFSGRLDESVALVMAKCSPSEFHAYRGAVGRVLGEMLLEIMNPLCTRHPTLKPAGFE
jgi:hypothetical protein